MMQPELSNETSNCVSTVSATLEGRVRLMSVVRIVNSAVHRIPSDLGSELSQEDLKIVVCQKLTDIVV